MRRNGRTLLSQRGIVVPIVVIGLLAILAVAGLALDGSHALGNKTRMQNTVDAAALAAAKVLDTTEGDVGVATAAANSLFSINANAAGNHELNAAYDAGDIAVTVQYSATLNPFVPGSFVPGSTSWFVRVIATGFDTRTSLSSVLGITEIPTPATAVAGPSGPIGAGEGAEVCDIAPIAVCQDDVKEAPADALRVLKPAPGEHEDVGPGNYKMLRLECPGGDCLRRAMAGSSGACATVGVAAETEPGVSSGPVSQGFNTRFNQHTDSLTPDVYPPDKYITEQAPAAELKSCDDPANPFDELIYLPTSPGGNYCKDFDPNDPTWADDQVFTGADILYNYCNYSGAGCTEGSGPFGPGPATNSGYDTPGRRLLTFPLIDCTGNNNGQSTLTVTGFACFFMLQSLQVGQSDGAGQIFGQFVDGCLADGTAGEEPGEGPEDPLLYKIQLYKDPDSTDS
jgi:Flp pilus assembly protein TadG